MELSLVEDHLLTQRPTLVQGLGLVGPIHEGRTQLPRGVAAAESFFSTIRKELIYRHAFKTRNAARLAIFDSIERFYNPVRRHSTLGNISPVDYELAAATATS